MNLLHMKYAAPSMKEISLGMFGIKGIVSDPGQS